MRTNGTGGWATGAHPRNDSAIIEHVRPGRTPDRKQVALPTLPAVIRTGPAVAFAHPAERELARLLTYYGVRWSYEPTTFALAPGDPRGAAFFTPDFYLPDHHLYLELTTMRQRLVTRKNRKLRLVRERYPGVSIKLLYRRDYQRLIDAYAIAGGDRGVTAGEVLISAAALHARIEALATELIAAGQLIPAAPPLILALGAGASQTHAALTAALRRRGADFRVGGLLVTSYQPGAGRARARVSLTTPDTVAGQRVIVVGDIVSSGLSLACVTDWLRRQGAAAITTCALLDRPAARLLDLPVDHVGFAIAAALVGGFGLTRCATLRDLPYLTTVTSVSVAPV